MSPSAGPGLILMSLLLVFQWMLFGKLVGVRFFAMMSIAALNSAILMLEATVA